MDPPPLQSNPPDIAFDKAYDFGNTRKAMAILKHPPPTILHLQKYHLKIYEHKSQTQPITAASPNP